MHQVVGKMNVLFVTVDCLRLDVARQALADGRTPTLARHLGPAGWEARETPGTFTLPAHLAFFHGFLPTPLGEAPDARLFALAFDGSLTTGPTTYVFDDAPNVIAGFAALGYRTFCVGGVGFFNKRNPLGRVLPGFFQQSVWSPALGVAAKESTAAQVAAALDWLDGLSAGERALLFVNVSATHPPHAHYLPGATVDGVDSQAAALAHVDRQLPRLFAGLRRAGAWFCLVLADHGEAFGEDGRWGHRIGIPTVTTVPYAHFFLD
ncbi:MAG: STM4013/SEN3800 family hydrolase [Gemmataceae bacterium]